MKNNEVVIFPTLINFVEDFLSKDQCKEIVQFAKTKEYKKHDSLEGDSVSNHGLNDTILSDIKNNIESCKDVEQNLYLFLNEYTNKVGLKSSKLNNSWINFQNKGSRLLPHRHPHNLVSGVIYLNTDENSSKIIFHNPNPFVSFTNKTFSGYFNYDYHQIKPTIGSLILFPSWLEHSSGSEVNMSEERVALSFNAN